jgi:hypothetical protein
MIRPEHIDSTFAWVKKKIGEGLTFIDAGLQIDIHPDTMRAVSDAFGEEPFTGPTGRIRIRNRQMNYDDNPPGALYKAGLSARQRTLVAAELSSTAEVAFLMGVRAATRPESIENAS